MKIAEIINENGLIVDIKAKTKKDALLEILARLSNENKLYSKDIASVLDSLLNRENMMSTGIGSGVATPHIKHPTVTVQTIVLARSMQGINWRSLDDKPVYVIWLILIPFFSYDHEKILARISRFIKIKHFPKNIMMSNILQLPMLIESMENDL